MRIILTILDAFISGRFYGRCRHRPDAAMAVVTEHPQVKELSSITGTDLHIRVFPGVDEAVAWLGEDGVTEAVAAK